jgi:hypothetical protein
VTTTSVANLKLVQENKIRNLLPNGEASKRFEASGVLAKGSDYFVVFDDRTTLARIANDLRLSNSNDLIGTAPLEGGYEGIAYNAEKHRYYLLVESLPHDGDEHRAEIVEYSDAFKYLKSRPLDFVFRSCNKGFEALAHVRRDGRDYALALCEGNKCQSGRKGREPGNGRVQLFEKTKKLWSHIGTVKLPKSVEFVDYSGMSLDDDRLAVVSQENSMLWIGTFDKSTWNWRDEGRTYEFPRAPDGEIQYGNVEGISWITPSRIVTVSDRRKSDQPKHFADKDESIHVFDIPIFRTD